LTIYKTILGNVYEWTPVNPVGGYITLLKTFISQAFAEGEFLVESIGLADDTYHLKSVTTSFPALYAPSYL
jgi:hypothetical protein